MPTASLCDTAPTCFSPGPVARPVHVRLTALRRAERRARRTGHRQVSFRIDHGPVEQEAVRGRSAGRVVAVDEHGVGIVRVVWIRRNAVGGRLYQADLLVGRQAATPAHLPAEVRAVEHVHVEVVVRLIHVLIEQRPLHVLRAVGQFSQVDERFARTEVEVKSLVRIILDREWREERFGEPMRRGRIGAGIAEGHVEGRRAFRTRARDQRRCRERPPPSPRSGS